MSGLNVTTAYITLRGILILEIVSGRGGWVSGLNVPTVYITLRGILILEIVSERGGWVSRFESYQQHISH